MKKPAIKNGIMHKMIVFDMMKGIQLGIGFIIYFADGKMSEPMLISNAGNNLSEDWYTLFMTDEYFNVVVPRHIQ
jgi:hypothetical protein